MPAIKQVLLDAGPWVDYLNTKGAHHKWSRSQFERFPSFTSCEAVLAEVCARCRYYGVDERLALESVQHGQVKLRLDLQEHVSPVLALMTQYRDQGMDLADACLLWMVHLEPRSLVVTLDRHFGIYRLARNQVVPQERPPVA
jgi:predicted nucleic acid-binding protein